MSKDKSIVVLSGGMDSTTALFQDIEKGFQPFCISFDYGQRHKKELEYAKKIVAYAERTFGLIIPHQIINLQSITILLSGSALTDDIAVPRGHYAEDSMKQTVVPNRNAIMLAIATAWAVSQGAKQVTTGVHAGDHPIYPDCRPDFISAFTEMEKIATEGFSDPAFVINAPFLHLGKEDIVKIGNSLGVPYSFTWSCYDGDELHCGLCGTCVERQEAFQLAGVYDPTDYC